MTYSDGSVYKGDWKENVREGKGVFTWSNGSVYEGDFKSDMFHGTGKMSWKDKDAVYEGEWSSGK